MAERAVPMRGGIVGRTYLEKGRPVLLVTRWSGKGPRNVLIRREVGELVVRPFRGLRVAPPDRAENGEMR